MYASSQKSELGGSGIDLQNPDYLTSILFTIINYNPVMMNTDLFTPLNFNIRAFKK